MKTIKGLITCAALLAALNANATISYKVGGTSINLGQGWFGAYDTVTLAANNSGSLDFTSGNTVHALLNTATWDVNPLAVTDTSGNTLTRSIDISLATSQNISQSASLNVNYFLGESQTLMIESSDPVYFNWTDGGIDYTLTVIAEALSLKDPHAVLCPNTWAGDIIGTFTLTSQVNPNTPGTAVPEPSTVVAGALLLLPFGVSTVRMLRKSRKV